MAKIDYAARATARLTAIAGWFEDLSPAQKKQYIKDHPTSKYAKKGTSTKAPVKPAKKADKDTSVKPAPKTGKESLDDVVDHLHTTTKEHKDTHDQLRKRKKISTVEYNKKTGPLRQNMYKAQEKYTKALAPHLKKMKALLPAGATVGDTFVTWNKRKGHGGADQINKAVSKLKKQGFKPIKDTADGSQDGSSSWRTNTYVHKDGWIVKTGTHYGQTAHNNSFDMTLQHIGKDRAAKALKGEEVPMKSLLDQT